MKERTLAIVWLILSIVVLAAFVVWIVLVAVDRDSYETATFRASISLAAIFTAVGAALVVVSAVMLASSPP